MGFKVKLRSKGGSLFFDEAAWKYNERHYKGKPNVRARKWRDTFPAGGGTIYQTRIEADAMRAKLIVEFERTWRTTWKPALPERDVVQAVERRRRQLSVVPVED